MRIHKTKGGIWVPYQKEKPKKPERPKQWDCPHCGVYFDSEKTPSEEYTVGSLNPKAIPHIICPSCKECMGCLSGS